MVKKEHLQIGLGFCVLALAYLLFLSPSGPGLGAPYINLPGAPGAPGAPGEPGLPGTPGAVVTVPPTSTSVAPTSFRVAMEPDNFQMGHVFAARVYSDGKDYPITLHAKHRGQGQEVVFVGRLDMDGEWPSDAPYVDTLDLPGYWEFWVTADNGVSSDITYITVYGVAVVIQDDHYSKSLEDSCLIQVFSHLTGNCGIIALDHEASISIPVTNAVINSGGYGEVAPSLDFLASKTYEIDAIIGGEKATDYGGTAWVEVGR